MGGFFGVASRDDCVRDLFYGTDYHSHLGTRRGGLAVKNAYGLTRIIHNISNAQFRSKFEDDLGQLHGQVGIGVISDFEDQPLIIGSHLGTYAIVTVGVVKNADALAQRAFDKRATHFSEMSGGQINPTELVATLINQAASFEDGIAAAQERHRRLLLDAAADRPRHLRRPRPPGPHARHHRAEGRGLGRHAGDLRLPQPGLRDGPLPGPRARSSC